MSYSIDVNILLYASDNESRLQSAAENFLNDRKKDSDLFCLTWLTLMSYQRIVTNLGIFKTPLTPQKAWQNIEDLLSLPQVRIIGEQENFPHHYLQTTSEMHVRGNLVSDAHLAAILREHGVSKIYSADSDFRKFKFLKVINPFQ